jgi:hypothetical protein
MENLGPSACSLSILLVTELVDDSLEDHLPINSLRNQAVLLAQTPLVAMLDADMVVSRSLAQSLGYPTQGAVSQLHTTTTASCCWCSLQALPAVLVAGQACSKSGRPAAAAATAWQSKP